MEKVLPIRKNDGGYNLKNITVIGSINVDLVAVSDKRPKAGETVIGKAFHTIAGGKGANQAVACARLGANVTMLGVVGNDTYGTFSLENLKENNINIDSVGVTNDITTGVAQIVIAENDNSIIVIPGANDKCDVNYAIQNEKTILASDLVILQLEIPLDTVLFISDLCKKNNIPVLLNPAPACDIPEKLIDDVTFITPNEHEFEFIFGQDTAKDTLLKSYPNKLLITEGSNGVVFYNGSEIVRVPANKVNVIDTTGAGDTFNGAFGAAFLNGKKIDEAIKYANLAAGISVTKLGAQGGMPTQQELDRWEQF
ncbi:MAG: ribokinase [Bacillales bacterium]|nr:ribokinase [Bacillales bacterium]